LSEKKIKAMSFSGGYKNRPFNLKELSAIWVGKILIIFTRILGRGGTTLPGRTALKIAPFISTTLSNHLNEGAILVTGTNGKTTTAALINNILKAAGYRCIHNQSGSNMAWGVASALIEAATWKGKLTGDFAVLEVDEGALQEVTTNVSPRGIVVTNIFRDQLDRYGEVDRIQETIKRGLNAQPVQGFQVINADDPSLVGIEKPENRQRWTFGLQLNLPDDTFQNTGRDMKTCPRCLHKLSYDKIYFAHLGHFYCPSCQYKRPKPDVALTNQEHNDDGSVTLKIKMNDELFSLDFPLMGTYNLYNLLAALTCAKALAIPFKHIATSLKKAVPSFGRMERFAFKTKTIIMALIKNPVGANEVLRTVLAQEENIYLMVAINDKIADGTDVSWLWDVDFEQLARDPQKISGLLASGLRAWDMAVRLKYAGFPPNRIEVEEITGQAVKKALNEAPDDAKLFILPTYTAMLEIRRSLNKLGLGKPYWED
jgi:lipid II isoglutaminyl synthase (glutamine-hydrolysing)